MERLSIDFVKRTIELTASLFVGDASSPDKSERERQRKGKLILKGFTYIALELPDPRYCYYLADTETLDHCSPDAEIAGRYSSPEGAFAGRFFLVDWNAFIHYEANDAEFVWIETEK